MELRDALVDEGLRLGLLGGDREVDLAHAGHPVGGVSRSVVERLAVHGMAGSGNGRVGLRGRRGRLDRLVAASRQKRRAEQSRSGDDRREPRLDRGRMRKVSGRMPLSLSFDLRQDVVKTQGRGPDSQALSVQVLVALQHHLHIVPRLAAPLLDPKELGQNGVLLADQRSYHTRENLAVHAAPQLTRDLLSDMEIDLDHRRLVECLEETVPLDCIHRRLLIDEVSGGEAVQKHLGLGLINGQLDHEVQVLGESGIAVVGRRDAVR